MKKQHRAILSIFVLCVFLLAGCARNVESLPKDSSEQEPADSTVEASTRESGSVQNQEAESGTAEGSTTENDTAGNSAAQDSTAENTPAPQVEFEGIDLDGNTVTDEIFSGCKLTMVKVWATYCDPCLREMPGLGELAAEYDAAEFQIIGIVSDVLEGDDQSLAEDLVEQTGAAYPHLLLNRSIYMALLTDVTAVPTTYFVNENREVLGSVLGSMQKSAWEEIIDELLEQLEQ